jgi:hypothetical protein
MFITRKSYLPPSEKQKYLTAEEDSGVVSLNKKFEYLEMDNFQLAGI